MKLKKINKNYFVLLLAGFLYSSLAFFTKNLTLAGVDPIDQVFWRIVIAFVCSLFLSITLFKQNARVTKREVKFLLVNSVIFVYGFVTWVLAIYLGTPITRALSLVFAYPIWISLFTYIVFKKLPTKKNIVAIIIALISISLILETWTFESLTDISFGDLFAIANSIAYAALIVWGAKVRRSTDLHPIKMLNFTLLFAIPILLLSKIGLSFLGIEVFSIPISFDFTINVWFNLFGIGFFGTVVTLVLIYYGMKKVNPNVASILLTTELLWVYVFGILFFSEVVKWSGLLGSIGMILAVLLV